MAKNWAQLSRILIDAGFDFDPEQAADSLAVLLKTSQRYTDPSIVFLTGGRITVGGLPVNAKRFAHSFCCSLESRSILTGLTFKAASETASLRQVRRDAARAEKQAKRFHGADWITIASLGSIRGKAFYSTPEWRAIRYQVLKMRGGKCEACGRTPKQGICLHVDHIFPRSTHPELALNSENLQVLCEDCNLGKGVQDTTRWALKGGDASA